MNNSTSYAPAPQACMVARLLIRLAVAGMLTGLVGCGENISSRQTVQGVNLGVAPATPGRLTLHFPGGYVARADVSAAATATASCLPDLGVLSCTPALTTAANGSAVLDWRIMSFEERSDSGRPRRGIALETPIDLEARFVGYRPTWSDCRRTALKTDMLWSSAFLADIALTEFIACDPLMPRPAEAGMADVVVQQVASQQRDTRQLLAVVSNGDYPLEVVLRTQLRGVTGWTRVDASCALPGWTGQPALFMASRSESAVDGNRYDFVLDRLQAPEPRAPRVDVLVQPQGGGQFGAVNLALSVESSGGAVGRVTTLRVPAANTQPLGPDRWYRALALPYDASASLRVSDEVLDAPDLGTCFERTIKVVAVRAAPRAAPARAGDAVDIDVQFSAPVVASAAALLLETGSTDRTAVLMEGSGGTVLRFRYTVAAGDYSTALDYFSREALTAGSADLLGVDGRGVDLALPGPGGAGSLVLAGVQIDAR